MSDETAPSTDAPEVAAPQSLSDIAAAVSPSASDDSGSHGKRKADAISSEGAAHKMHVIRLKGLRWQVKKDEVKDFLATVQVEEIHFSQDPAGSRAGEAYVQVCVSRRAMYIPSLFMILIERISHLRGFTSSESKSRGPRY